MGDFYIDNKGIIGVPPGIPGSLPSKHAKHHITGGTDVIPNATDVNSGLMSPTDKQKLDAITQEKIDTWNTVTEKANKVHAIHHITGGTDVIPNATDVNSGLMSPTDKQKLDAITQEKIDTWNTVTEKANKVDVYTKSEVNNLLSQAGYGDMMKATYDADNDGVVDLAKDADTVDGKHFTDIQNDAQSKVNTHANVTASLSTFGHVKYAVLTATLDTTWSGSAAPYTQTVTVSNITSTDAPIIDVVMSGTYSTDSARAEAWGYIYRAVTGNGTITFYATEKPTVSLPIQIRVVR